jgi:hypothetical protein
MNDGIRAPGDLRYDARFNFALPQRVADAVAARARDRMMSVNSWLRGAVLDRLEREDDNKHGAAER